MVHTHEQPAKCEDKHYLCIHFIECIKEIEYCETRRVGVEKPKDK